MLKKLFTSNHPGLEKVFNTPEIIAITNIPSRVAQWFGLPSSVSIQYELTDLGKPY